MSEEKRWDSVGWGFFCVALVLWSFPCVYFIFQITSDAITIGARTVTGVGIAFVAAGFTSWLVNSMLNYRAERLASREAPKAQSRKKKKKAK